MNLERIDVLGVDLRTNIGANFGVGYGDPVDQPTGLVAAADVEHVVRHVRAGDVVGNHLHAIGGGGSRGFVDHLAGDHCGWRDRISGKGIRVCPHHHGLCGIRKWQRNVHDGIGSRCNLYRLRDTREAGSRDIEAVNTNGNLGNAKFAIGGADAVEDEARFGGLESDLRVSDGPMLGIMNDAVKRRKDGSVREDGHDDEEKN